MQNTINSDLIRGNINTIILKALFEGDRYGYDIIKEIEQKSSGQYVLKQPTLYSCLKRLEVQGFIRSYWGAKSIGGRRKYYTLTDMGRELFVRNQTEWEYSRTVIDKLISDREYDLSEAEKDSARYSHSSATKEVAEEVSGEEAYNRFEENLEPAGSNESEEYAAAADPIMPDDAAEFFPDPDAPPSEQEYLNTAEILDELFKRQQNNLENDSYTGKLVNEAYKAAPPQKKPVVSTIDYTDADEDAEISEDDPYEAPQSAGLMPMPMSMPADLENSPAPKPQSGFLSYDSKIEYEENEKQKLVERDYKNVLSQLVKGQSTAVSVPEAEPAEMTPALIPLSKEMESANQYIADSIAKPTAEDLSLKEQHGQKFNALSSSFRELGDNISIREHSTLAAKEHAEMLYYYPYRLMLLQFGILFGIMLIMTAFTFLLARVGLGILNTADVYVYALSIALAVAFPIVSAILNFRNPDKTRRIQYNFKTSLIYRCILFVNCLVIIYCVNIYLGMPLSFSIQYLCPLLLPALLSVCFPISTMIFNALYNSGKYAAK